jgi:hypothetical protein
MFLVPEGQQFPVVTDWWKVEISSGLSIRFSVRTNALVARDGS